MHSLKQKHHVALGMTTYPIFFKLALPYIENSLAILFNTSIETSTFPDAWKLAKVTPILKEGDQDEY